MIKLFIIPYLVFANTGKIWAAEAGPSKADTYTSYFYNSAGSSAKFTKVLGDVSEVVCTAANCAGRTAEATAQAFFLISALAAIEGMKQQSEISGIKKESLSLEQKAQAANASVERLLTSSEFDAGIIGMFSVNRATKPALDVIKSIIMNTNLRPILKEFISKSAVGIVGFVGYEASAELMSRAIQMIPGETDRTKAEKIGPTLMGALASTDASKSEDDLRVISLVKNNVLKILIDDPTLREKWWSFVVRNRVQTGNFSIGISMMTMGGMAGTQLAQCVPGRMQKIALPALGMTLGIAGGVAASYVSTETKDDITKSFQSVRMKAFQAQLHTSQTNLAGAIKRIENEQRTNEIVGIDSKKPSWKMDRIRDRINEELAMSDQIRQNLLTTFFDQFHLLNSRMLVIQNKLDLAIMHDNVEAQKSLLNELDTYKKAYAGAKKNLEDTMGEELKMYELFRSRKIPMDAAVTIGSKTVEIESVKKWTSKFVDQIQTTSNWGKKASSNSLMDEQENQRLLEKIYMWGFQTKPFLKTMEYNN